MELLHAPAAPPAGTGPAAAILEALPLPCLAVDAGWRVRAANAALREIWGAAVDGIAGAVLWEALPWLGGSVLGQRLRAAVAADVTRFDAPCPLRSRPLRLRTRRAGDGITVLLLEDAPAASPDAEHLRLAMEAGTFGTWEVDLLAGTQTWSEELRAIIGLRPNALPGPAAEEAVHPSDLPGLRAAFESALDPAQGEFNGGEFGAEFRVTDQASGRERWVAARGRASFGPDGRPARVAGVTFDIDARKRSELALQASEARLRIASETARIGYWERDLTTGALHSSAICKANYGRKPEADLPYAEILAAIHPEYRARVREAAARAAREGTEWESEYPITWPDGSTHWISVRGRRIAAPDGTPLRNVGTTRDVTARRQAQEALRESEQRFRHVFEQSPLGKAIIGSDFRFREVNPALCRMLGATPEELVGRRFLDLVHPDDREECLLQAQALMAGTLDHAHTEERFLHRSGAPLWVSVNVAPLRDAAGRVVATLGIIENIDDQRRLEQALRESQEWLTLAQQAACIGTWDWDLRTGRLHWSAEQFRVLGLDPERDAADPYAAWLRVLHPEDRAAADAAARSRLSTPASFTPSSFTHEFRILRDGAVRTIQGTGRAITEADGRIVRIVGVSIDVTDRKRMEERLRGMNAQLERQVEERARQLADSRARLRTFFDNSPDWLTLQHGSPDGPFVYEDLNPTCEQAYGLTRDQVVGRRLEEVLGEEAAQLPLHYLRECVRTGQPQRYMVRRTMAGRTRVIDVMIVAIPGEAAQGEEHPGERMVITTARDITERMELEAQLAQAQKMEAVGQLTGGIAHDFNNLLTVVLGALETLDSRLARVPEAADLARMRRAADAATQAARRAAALTTRLLAFSRKQALAPKPVDVNALVGGMSELLRRTLGESVTIATALADGLGPVMVDPNQLESALLNLAVNARDAMRGSGTLTIATAEAVPDAPGEAPSGPCAAISVTDTGTGMTPEVMARAFEPFFTTKDVGHGTGLGLSQVYGFVSQSGGRVALESRPGQGTTVRIYLPLQPAGDAAGEAAPASAAASAPFPGVVLVVEDNEAVRAYSTEALRELGCLVLEAPDGGAALDLLDRHPEVALLFTDIGLPGGMSGVALAKEARRRRPDLKVLLTTGYTQPATLTGAAAEAALPLLAKPFTPAELAVRLRQAL